MCFGVTPIMCWQSFDVKSWDCCFGLAVTSPCRRSSVLGFQKGTGQIKRAAHLILVFRQLFGPCDLFPWQENTQLWLNLLRVTLLLCSKMVPVFHSSVEQRKICCCQIASGCCASVCAERSCSGSRRAAGSSPASSCACSDSLHRIICWSGLCLCPLGLIRGRK